MLPPSARPHKAVDSIPAKLLHSSLNKVKHPINVVKWTPEGRRLLTGSSIGEFTLWNGMGFNFETISQVGNIPFHDAVDQANVMSVGTRQRRSGSGVVTRRRLAYLIRATWCCKVLAAYI